MSESPDKYRLKAVQIVGELWFREPLGDRYESLVRIVSNALAEAARETTERAAKIATSTPLSPEFRLAAKEIAEAIRRME